MVSPSPRTLARLAAFGVLLTFPLGAGAAPRTVADPAGSGAVVTLSDDTLYPGQRVSVTGTGFVGQSPSADPADLPAIAIKPYDIDVDWGWGSDTSALTGFMTSDAKIWFQANRTGAGWGGWIDIPTTLTPAGLLPGESAGQHWFRILSGAFSTTGGPFVGNTTTPISFKAPFTVVDRVTLGLTSFDNTRFQAGRTFRPGAQITPRGTDFPANRPITATLDGASVAVNVVTVTPGTPPVSTLEPASTEADGTFPAAARVVLPGATAAGKHQLAFSVSPAGGGAAETASYEITVTPPPTIALSTPAARPGGRIAFTGTGFTGVAGTGQKVAVVLNEQTLACITASDDGALRGTAVLPATVASPAVLGFNAGTSCKGPTGPQDDLPGTRVAPSLTVSASAPTAAAAPSGAAGASLAVSGEGFPTGSVAVELDGAPLPAALVAGEGGAFSGAVAVPRATLLGEHLLTFRSDGATAVALFTATAADPEPLVTPTPQSPGAPGVTPSPGPTATPPASLPPVLSLPPRKAKLAAGSLTLKFATTPPKGTKITVASAGKLKLGKTSKAKIVTFAKHTVKRPGKVTLKLTAAGTRALRQLGKVKVRVSVLAPGAAKPATKTFTIRR